MVRNVIHFYGEELLAPCPTSQLEDYLLLTVSECLFSIFASRDRDSWRALVNAIKSLLVP